MKQLQKSYIAAQRQAALKIKADVCKLLNWSEEQYATLQYKNGLIYLQWFLPCDDVARKQLEGSRLFWNWWKHCWVTHDQAILDSIEFFCDPAEDIVEVYMLFHCPRALVLDIRPNSIVLNSIKKKEVLL